MDYLAQHFYLEKMIDLGAGDGAPTMSMFQRKTFRYKYSGRVS